MDGFNALWHAGHRSRGHRHPGRGRAAARRRGQDARRTSGARPSSARVWKWKEESGGTIIRQLKRLGASCDWSRERFTMDAGLSAGGARGLRAALRRRSDLPRRLHRQLVPALPDRALRPRGRARGARRGVRLHQVRSAHARHRAAGDQARRHRPGRAPEGQALRASTSGKTSRSRRWRAPSRVRVVADERGRSRSSAPASSRSRRATIRSTSRSGERHDLPDPHRHRLRRQDDGSRRQVRRARSLRDAASASSRTCRRSGSSTASSRTVTPSGVCYRCKTVVEPLVSKQWYVQRQAAGRAGDQGGARAGASRSSRAGGRRPTTSGWRTSATGTISRQLWWGHRIPAWYCDTDGSDPRLAHGPQRSARNAAARFARITDVLDTWFSSGLWPFSTLGWPDETPELRRRSIRPRCLVTGFDILFFWVARMAMLGLHFMERRAVPRRLHPRPRARRRGAEDVEVEGQRRSIRWRSWTSTAPTPSASRSPRSPPRAATSASARSASRATATSPTSSGTPRASC